MNKHNERAELIRELKELAEALPFEGGRYMDYAAELVTKAAALLEAQRPALKPLTNVEARNLCTCGPVYAPDGVVTLRPNEYRREIENAMVLGLRKGEAAHGI